jgi:hypothetical protein
MDLVTAAAVDMLRRNSEELRAAVTGLSVEQLNRAPVKDSSSLAILVEHSVSGTIALVDAAVTGQMDRGRYMNEIRPAAFATNSAGEKLLHESLDRLDARIAQLEQQPPTDGYEGHVQYQPPVDGPPRARVWSLIHAIEHLREHVGHAQITRQIIEEGR